MTTMTITTEDLQHRQQHLKDLGFEPLVEAHKTLNRINRLIAGNNMIARFDSWGRDAQTIKIPLNGFTQATTSLAAACSI
jgi:hypothetical protein